MIHSSRRKLIIRGIHTTAKARRNKKARTVGIPRETVNAWERRAPLAPSHVRKLVNSGINVLVQPSNRRAFPMSAYQAAGAVVEEDLSASSVIMSVKTPRVEDLIPDMTYAFFSHTIKAQKENMPLLDAILNMNIRLLDYEKMVDSSSKRLVAFGKWAGYAGMIDVLHGMGLRFLALGHHTPFLHIGLAHNYRDSHMAVNAVRDAGYEIALDLMPRSLGPLIFVFTGSGNVSLGAQEVFQNLPHERVAVSTLSKVAKYGALNKVYSCVVDKEDHLVRKDGGPFDFHEFLNHPDLYYSTFASDIAPYATLIVNGIYWAPGHPRLLTIPDAKNLMTPLPYAVQHATPGCPTLPHRLVAICDISADPCGSIEFWNECTKIDSPFNIYDSDTNRTHYDFSSPSGVLMCSIDNMPAQMPLEATQYFGDKLLPFVFEMAASDALRPFSEFEASPVVKNAVIASNGGLTQNYEYIAELRKQQSMQSAHKTGRLLPDNKRVLILGAGFVSGPAVEYLAADPNVSVTVASHIPEHLETLNSLGLDYEPIPVNVEKDGDKVEKLIQGSDVVISLLPYGLHPRIARMCIKHKVDMVTSSYQSEEMESLHGAAAEAGITIVNEVGLDPGIDHMLSMECVHAVHDKGGKVINFESWGTGLPAPEYSDNPLRYKFSWSPKGVIMALQNPAKYLENNKEITVGPGQTLNFVRDINFLPGYNLVGYPNRDCTIYKKLYGIPECEGLIRGSMRYQGFVEAIRGLGKLGLLDTASVSSLDPNSGPPITWKQYLAMCLNQKPDIFEASLKDKVRDKLDNEVEFKAIVELGLTSDQLTVPRNYTPIDSLTTHLERTLAYEKGERDMVILRHNADCKYPDGTLEKHAVDLVVYGNPNGFSAMASTVGYTAAIVTKMIISGEIQKRGLVLPLTRDIYRPVLQRLAKLGIEAKTKITKKDVM